MDTKSAEELESILDFINHEVWNLSLEVSPNMKGHFPRKAAEKALNIAFNLEAILHLRDTKKLLEFGYTKRPRK